MFDRSRPQSRNVKILLLALGYFFMFGYSNVSYLLPIYYSAVGFSPAQSGLLASSYFVASLIFRLVLGGLLARWGFKRFFTAGSVITVASAIWVVFADSFSAAFVARFLLGAGTAFHQIALASYQSMAFAEKERGFAFSVIMAGGLAPMMTAVPIADRLLANGSLTLYILIPVVQTALLAVVTLIFLDTDDVALVAPRSGGNPFKGVLSCFKVPELAFALSFVFLFSLVDASSAFMSIMTASYGLMASFFLSSNAVVGVFVRLFLGKALDKYPRQKLAAPIIIGMALMLLFASICPTHTSLMVLGFIFGIGMGFGFPLCLALVSDCAPMRLQPQAISLTWFFVALDFAVIPAALSYICGVTTPVAGFRIVVILILLSVAGAEYMRRRMTSVKK